MADGPTLTMKHADSAKDTDMSPTRLRAEKSNSSNAVDRTIDRYRGQITDPFKRRILQLLNRGHSAKAYLGANNVEDLILIEHIES